MEELELEVNGEIYKVRDKGEMYMVTRNDTFTGYIVKKNLTFSGHQLDPVTLNEIIRKLS